MLVLVVCGFLVQEKNVFIHYGMRDYDFDTFDGWFIGPMCDYNLGITTPGKDLLKDKWGIYPYI